MDDLGAIFAKRLGGTYTIRGISYQIKYSILRAFELHENKIESLTLEGIEDVDLNGLHLDDNCFIQVKTSEEPWKWSQLRAPIKNFIEVYKLHHNGKFVLVLNCYLKGDLEKLSRYKELETEEKKEIEKKFIKLLKKELVNEPDELFLNFLDNLSISYLNDDELSRSINEKITKNLDVKTSASEIYLSVLISNFLDWAKERKTIRKLDISKLVEEIKEHLTIETAFEAIGDGLIKKINWDTNNFADDFYEGKNTQPSHISSNADYKRVEWLQTIDRVLKISNVCVIRGSSGQGKSTLLYRYAYDYSIRENTYKLSELNTSQHLELVLHFLRHRAKLGLQIIVLVDNVNLKLKHWADLIEACSGLEIQFLITIRKEDWFRYGKASFEFRAIEPILYLEEAKQIFRLLKQNGKIHSSIKSPEVAFERIGENKLLIEYMYLITHGEMLLDRLVDQIKQISSSNEDPVKIDILRKVSLANVFNAPLQINKLINTLNFKIDQQKILESLEGEYIKIEDGLLYGLHWIRTEHLYKILFAKFLNPAVVALEILKSIPNEYIKVFISDFILEENVDKNLFSEGLQQMSHEFNSDIIIGILEGYYIAGEKNFFNVNKNIFNQANELLGEKGPWLLTGQLSIIEDKDAPFDALIESLGPEKGINFIKIRELKSQIVYTERGIDYCRGILIALIKFVNPEIFTCNHVNIAKFLDTLFFCNISISLIDKYKQVATTFLKDYININIQELIMLFQSIFRVDRDLMTNWFLQNKTNVENYLKLVSDSVYLTIEDEKLSFKFIPKSEHKSSAHEQTIKRVKLFREILPFLKSISSEGLYFLPENLKPTHDETIKNITIEDFYFKLDVERNVTFLNVVKEKYYINSYYEYQESLYLLRSDILKFFKEFSIILTKKLKHIPHLAKNNFENGELINRIYNGINKIPNLPPQTDELIKNKIEKVLSEWSIGIRSFITQIDSYIMHSEKASDLNLALLNLQNSINKLEELHKVTDELCVISPDYFSLKELNLQEVKSYNEFYDLVELRYKNNPTQKIDNPLSYIRKIKNKELFDKINTIKSILGKFTEYILSDQIVNKESVSYYSIMFEINGVNDIFSQLIVLIERLYPIKQNVDFFFLIPIKNRKKISDKHYMISSRNLEKMELGEDINWEALSLMDWKKELIQGLPNYEIELLNEVTKESLLAGFKLNIQCFENYKNIILMYLSEDNEHDKILKENYSNQLKEMLKEFIVSNNQFKSKIKTIDFEYKNEILRYLDEIENESITIDVLKIDYSNWKTTLTDRLEHITR